VPAVRGDFLEDEGDEDEPGATSGYVVPRGVEGAAATFKDTISRVAGKPTVLIIRLRRTPVMDATGLHALTEVVHRSRKEGTLVLLSELQPQPLATLSRSALLDEIGAENVCATMDEALARAREELELRNLLDRWSGRRGAAVA
jgi:sulfate permease, SulP family